jgi:hypothetical protein
MYAARPPIAAVAGFRAIRMQRTPQPPDLVNWGEKGYFREHHFLSSLP